MSILGYMKNQPYWYLFQQFSESSVLQVALLPSIPPETSGANPQLHKSWKLLLSQLLYLIATEVMSNLEIA